MCVLKLPHWMTCGIYWSLSNMVRVTDFGGVKSGSIVLIHTHQTNTFFFTPSLSGTSFLPYLYDYFHSLNHNINRTCINKYSHRPIPVLNSISIITPNMLLGSLCNPFQ